MIAFARIQGVFGWQRALDECCSRPVMSRAATLYERLLARHFQTQSECEIEERSPLVNFGKGIVKVPGFLGIWVTAAFVASFYASSSSAHTMEQVETELVASEPHVELVDEQAYEFSLRRIDGGTVNLSDFLGKVVVVNFVTAGCRGSCPSQVAIIAKIQSLQAEGQGLRDQVQFVSIVESDVEMAETHAAMRGLGLDPSNWILLSGATGQEIQGQETGSGREVAEAVFRVIDASGRLRARFYGLEFSPSRLMLYAAALAHGAHAPAIGAVGKRSDLGRRLLFGAVASGVGMLVFLAWVVWSRHSRHRADTR